MRPQPHHTVPACHQAVPANIHSELTQQIQGQARKAPQMGSDTQPLLAGWYTTGRVVVHQEALQAGSLEWVSSGSLSPRGQQTL